MNDIKGIIEDVEKSDLVSDKVIKKVIEIIGQEEWQEINDKKSDICTTTGELIITLKRIPDLEKEIEELKSEKGCETCTIFDEVKLTKAKEIIKDLMSFPVQLCDCRHTVDFEKTREQAVQFLKEIEK